MTAADDGVHRELGGLRADPHNIPAGRIGAYYPGANVLLPMWHNAAGSNTPVAKNIPVWVFRDES